MTALFADVSLNLGANGGLVQSLFYFLIIGICVALVWWVGTWFISKLGAPGVASTVWNGLFILVGLIVIINFLMGLSGHPFIRW